MPRRSKSGRFVKGGSHKRRSHTKRRRRNPPYQFTANPRRRRRHVAKTHHRRIRRRRNPGMLKGMGGLIPAPQRILFGAAGAIASRVIPDQLGRFIPQLRQVGPAGLAVRALAGIGGGYLVGKFMGKQKGEDFALGAMITIADEAFSLYLAPQLGMGSYLSSYLSGAYMAPGANLLDEGDDNSDGMSGAYGPDRLSAYSRF